MKSVEPFSFPPLLVFIFISLFPYMVSSPVIHQGLWGVGPPELCISYVHHKLMSGARNAATSGSSAVASLVLTLHQKSMLTLVQGVGAINVTCCMGPVLCNVSDRWRVWLHQPWSVVSVAPLTLVCSEILQSRVGRRPQASPTTDCLPTDQ